MTTTDNKAIARRFYDDAINGRKLHLLDELVAEGFVDHNPDPGQQPGRDGMKGMFRQFLEAFPDLNLEVDSMVAEADRVGVHVTAIGTHLGAFAGLPATGNRATVTGIDWLRIQNGKVVERWGVFDMVGMMKQIGAIPGPSASELKAASRRYYELLDNGRGDMAKLRAELFHPQFLAHFGGQPRALDAAAFQQLASGFWAGFPDLRHEIVDQICEGDTVFNRLSAVGTHAGEFAGVKPSNLSVRVDAIAAHRYADGKMIEQWVEADFAALLQQIGAMPKP